MAFAALRKTALKARLAGSSIGCPPTTCSLPVSSAACSHRRRPFRTPNRADLAWARGAGPVPEPTAPGAGWRRGETCAPTAAQRWGESRRNRPGGPAGAVRSAPAAGLPARSKPQGPTPRDAPIRPARNRGSSALEPERPVLVRGEALPEQPLVGERPLVTERGEPEKARPTTTSRSRVQPASGAPRQPSRRGAPRPRAPAVHWGPFGSRSPSPRPPAQAPVNSSTP